MQINTTGLHQSEMHHVTNCMHDHGHTIDQKMDMPASGGTNTPQTTETKTETLQPTFSLSAWLQNALSGAQVTLFKLFGTLSDGKPGDTNQKGAEVMAPISPSETSLPHITQVEAVSTLAQTPTIDNNPHFVPIQENTTPWQRIKVRFQNIAGSLTGFMAKHFSFSNNSSFHTKQERPKEDLSRHSRFRKDEVEINCIITDDSFLMDSYNNKGEYSKLSSKIK